MLVDESELSVAVSCIKLSLEDTMDSSDLDELQTINATLESSVCDGTMPGDTDERRT